MFLISIYVIVCNQYCGLFKNYYGCVLFYCITNAWLVHPFSCWRALTLSSLKEKYKYLNGKRYGKENATTSNRDHPWVERGTQSTAVSHPRVTQWISPANLLCARPCAGGPGNSGISALNSLDPVCPWHLGQRSKCGVWYKFKFTTTDTSHMFWVSSFSLNLPNSEVRLWAQPCAWF